MMKKRDIFLTCIAASIFWGCADFLSAPPNKSGSADLYHMDQLLGLTGNSALYRAGSYWVESLFRGDGIGIEPYMIFLNAGRNEYATWSWNSEYLETTANTYQMTWRPTWDALYTFNTVLENLDIVTQTTPSIRKQVEGEALFGRAYFHFMALVQYSLWDDDAPGIGYRLNGDPGEVPARETVKFTIDHVLQDLDDAEAALMAAGRTRFELTRNFRPTVPTVKAFRARVHLYRGNYAAALENANAALAGYDYLHDFKNDPLYVVERRGTVRLLDETNSYVASTVDYQNMRQLIALDEEAAWQYQELYLPHIMNVFCVMATNNLSISESTYDRFDRENDERWKRFYDNNYMLYSRIAQSITLPGNTSPTTYCVTWEAQQSTSEASHHTYWRFGSYKYYMLGPTTAEMYLIKAECLARAGNTAEAAQLLRTLRQTRFTTVESANNIGGTIDEVLEERAREMTEMWRFFDIKRLNGCENANIVQRRTILTDRTDLTSLKEVVILPDDPGYALPILNAQTILMGWQKN